MSDCCKPAAGTPGADGFDVAVIGAGSAGFSAAITAAGHFFPGGAGAKVALIGHGLIGGTCVNVGCVPSKALIRAAQSLHQARSAHRFAGIGATAQLENWAALRAQKDELVTGLRQAKYEHLLPQYETITYRPGKAAFARDGTLLVDGLPLQADKIILATGAGAAEAAIDGISDVAWIDSTAVFELEELPPSMTIVGGGYIGCELAQMLARFGVQVSLVCRSRLLPHGEPEISAALQEVFEGEGIAVETGLTYQKVQRSQDGVALHVERDGETRVLNAHTLVLATGRAPNTSGMGLAGAGIKRHKGGAIVVDAQMQTSRKGVYAAGDVTGRDQFVYMAAYGAKIAAKNALGAALSYDNTAMPAVTFTDPQVAGVGHTEASARAIGISAKTSLLPLSAVPRALAARETRGLFKLVADADTDRLIGAHIMAEEAGDTIQSAALAIRAGMSVADLGATIFPYLTMVEGLKLAAQTFSVDVAQLSCCAG